MGTNSGISTLVKGEERVVSGKERRKAERKGGSRAQLLAE